MDELIDGTAGAIQTIQNELEDMLREATELINGIPLDPHAPTGAKYCPDCKKIGVPPFEIEHEDGCIVERIKQLLKPDPWNSINDRQTEQTKE